MNDLLKCIGWFIVVALMIGIGLWWQVYRYDDCKKVGHATMYCILTIGK